MLADVPICRRGHEGELPKRHEQRKKGEANELIIHTPIYIYTYTHAYKVLCLHVNSNVLQAKEMSKQTKKKKT